MWVRGWITGFGVCVGGFVGKSMWVGGWVHWRWFVGVAVGVFMVVARIWWVWVWVWVWVFRGGGSCGFRGGG